ncbi:MAG TPA: hypothetical protein VIY52_25510 [Streptosporangiaceae bacterium]
MNDQELITAVRQSVHGVRMTVPAEQIISRSRAIRASGHRRLAACITAVAAAGSVVLGLGLSGVLGAAPNGGTGTIRTAAPARSTGTIRTAAFTLTRNADGTDTLTLRLTMRQILDPAALQQALAQDGIRALVKTGTYCSSSPAPPSPTSIGVLSVQLPDGTPVPGPARPVPSSDLNRIVAKTVTVINPAAIPSGTELFFGYFNSDHAVFFDLIYTSSYTCSNGLPPGGPAGS